MVEIGPGKHIVWNPRIMKFEYMEFERGRLRTVKYSRGEYLGDNEVGYGVYSVFNKYVVFDEDEQKIIQILDSIGVSITFSIETKGGHQEFAVEITAETLIDVSTDKDMVVDELMNTVNKMLYIMYDIQKDIPKAHPASSVAMSIRQRLWNSIRRGVVECRDINRYWDALTFIGILTRDRKAYISSKIYKIGEELLTGEVPPEYPDAILKIEMNKPKESSYEIIIKNLGECR